MLVTDEVGDRRYPVKIAGTSHYQDALLALAGGTKGRFSVELHFDAKLHADQGNPHDPYAVSVCIGDFVVGHVPKPSCSMVRAEVSRNGGPLRVPATVTGGWRRTAYDEGLFGVRIYLPELQDWSGRTDTEMQLNREDLPELVIEALRAQGGSAYPIEVCKYIWQHHEDDLRESGDLFYSWQYDVRWAAQKLRDAGELIAVKGIRNRPWELA